MNRRRLAVVLFAFAMGVFGVLLYIDTRPPEPTQTVIEFEEFDPEDVVDLVADADDFSAIIFAAPERTEPYLVFNFPVNAQGFYGDVMEVDGTGDLEIECGTLKFENGKLVGIVGCGKVVMFATTDVWP